MTRLEEIVARQAAADLPWEVKTDTLSGPVIHDPYNEVARIEVTHPVWDCDDEQDGCPDIRRDAIRRAEFIAHAPDDIEWFLQGLERVRRELQEEHDTHMGSYCDGVATALELLDEAFGSVTR